MKNKLNYYITKNKLNDLNHKLVYSNYELYLYENEKDVIEKLNLLDAILMNVNKDNTYYKLVNEYKNILLRNEKIYNII